MAGRIKEAVATGFEKLSEWTARVAAWLRPPVNLDAYKARLARWQQLWFIADVPLFADDLAVKRLYDALVRPQFEITARKRSRSTTRTVEETIESELKLETDIAPFLFKGSTSVKGSARKSEERTAGREYSEDANHSTEMRIEQIVSFYVRRFPKYLFWASKDLTKLEDLEGNVVPWSALTDRLKDAAPRPLIVLDLEPESRLIPMAAELMNAKVIKLYEALDVKLNLAGKKMPKYVESHGDPDGAKAYWAELHRVYEPRLALEVVEDCTTKEASRLDWIDFRLVVAADSNSLTPLHLHAAPRGQYATGTFAYQTIRRCYKYGMRIVGTLKMGEDINVVAMYEN